MNAKIIFNFHIGLSFEFLYEEKKL